MPPSLHQADSWWRWRPKTAGSYGEFWSFSDNHGRFPYPTSSPSRESDDKKGIDVIFGGLGVRFLNLKHDPHRGHDIFTLNDPKAASRLLQRVRWQRGIAEKSSKDVELQPVRIPLVHMCSVCWRSSNSCARCLNDPLQVPLLPRFAMLSIPGEFEESHLQPDAIFVL